MWNNFEITSGTVTEIKLFQTDVDEGWNNFEIIFISHVTTALLAVPAYNDRVLAFLRQPNLMDLIKERSRTMWNNTQLKNKITLIRGDGIAALERFANDVDLITLLRSASFALTDMTMEIANCNCRK